MLSKIKKINQGEKCTPVLFVKIEEPLNVIFAWVAGSIMKYIFRMSILETAEFLSKSHARNAVEKASCVAANNS